MYFPNTDLPENILFSSSLFIVTLFPHYKEKLMNHLSLISLRKTALSQETSTTQNKARISNTAAGVKKKIRLL